MSFKTSKMDAKVYFVSEDPPVSVGPYTSLIHLFEDDHKPGVTFWYGVADIASTEAVVIGDLLTKGLVTDSWNFHAHVALSIDLNDGRTGVASILTCSTSGGSGGAYLEVAFSARKSLAVPCTDLGLSVGDL